MILLLLAASLQAATYETVGYLKFPDTVDVGPMSGVEVDRAGNIYVIHRGKQPVAKFAPDGTYVKSWGEGMFKVPHGLRTDKAGNIWTTDNGNHVLRVFSPEGQLLRTIGELNVAGKDDTHFRSPDDIAFTPKGDYYVADAGNARILHFAADGKLIRQFGKKGKGAGEFATAHSLALGKNRVYVGDRGNKRVVAFDFKGNHVGDMTGMGNPFGMLVLGNQMITTEGDAHQLTLLSLKTGKIEEQWGTPQTLLLPHLLASGKGGLVYVTEVNGKRVQILRKVSKR